jgi:hypothetical protein
MANIRKWLEQFEQENKETIIAIVVGPHDDDRWEETDRRPEYQRDVVLTREQGLAILDVEYNNGYGGADCFPMYAWTEKSVLSISEYDGATSLNSFPRNPVNCTPTFD